MKPHNLVPVLRTIIAAMRFTGLNVKVLEDDGTRPVRNIIDIMGAKKLATALQRTGVRDALGFAGSDAEWRSLVREALTTR